MTRKEFLELNPNFKYQAEPGYELIPNSDLTAFMIMPTLEYKLQKARREIADYHLLKDLKVKADYGDYDALIASIVLENTMKCNQVPKTD